MLRSSCTCIAISGTESARRSICNASSHLCLDASHVFESEEYAASKARHHEVPILIFWEEFDYDHDVSQKKKTHTKKDRHKNTSRAAVHHESEKQDKNETKASRICEVGFANQVGILLDALVPYRCCHQRKNKRQNAEFSKRGSRESGLHMGVGRQLHE